jgi:hypothetical protein
MDSNILKLQLSMNKNSTGKFYIMWGSGPSCCCSYPVFVCGSSSVYLICSVFTLDHYFFALPALCLHHEQSPLRTICQLNEEGSRLSLSYMRQDSGYLSVTGGRMAVFCIGMCILSATWGRLVVMRMGIWTLLVIWCRLEGMVTHANAENRHPASSNWQITAILPHIAER